MTKIHLASGNKTEARKSEHTKPTESYPPMPPLSPEYKRLWERHLNSKNGYEPCIRVMDVKKSISSGCREPGMKDNCVHHLLSLLERDAFLIVDATRCVLGAKTQFPADPEITWRKCCEHGLEHPHLGDGLTVVTIDILVTLLVNGKIVHIAIDVKPSDELQDEDVVRKLQIARLWCDTQGYIHTIWTEKDINRTLASNIKELRDSLNIEEFQISELQIAAARQFLAPRLHDGAALSDLCLECDKALGLDYSISMRIVKFLIAKGIWQYDLREKFDPAKPVTSQYITCDQEDSNDAPKTV